MNFNSDRLQSKRYRTSPLIVNLKRSSSIESVHRVHAVVSDSKGRVLMSAGSTDIETYIRSALKPFQALPFISSGTAEKIDCGEKSVAIICASHKGTKDHAREAFKILWNSDVSVDLLQCPIPVNKSSRLEHNCSGKHAGFLATSKKMGWQLENYLDGKHPLQVEINRRVAELLCIPAEELIAARDDCGAPTLLLQLSQMSLLYAHLSESKNPDFEQIRRAMLAHPQLIAGVGGFDTELMNRAHGQLVSKGGAEGIQCLSKVGEGIGLAIKVEDGSKRAKQAVALHLMRQLEWMTPTGLQELDEKILLLAPGVQLEVNGELRFQES
mgnify:FL=1